MSIDADMIERFRGMFPGLLYDSCVIETALIEGDQETGGSRWGAYDPDNVTIKQRGMFYFAAHWLVVNIPNAGNTKQAGKQAVNPVASKSVADESISFAVNTTGIAATDQWLLGTNYGQQFLRLRRRVGMGAIVV